MAKQKLKKDEFLDGSFDFEKGVRVGAGGLTKSTLEAAKMKAVRVDEKRSAKVLKSVRYDADLIENIRRMADANHVRYQTLMGSLLRHGYNSAVAGRPSMKKATIKKR